MGINGEEVFVEYLTDAHNLRRILDTQVERVRPGSWGPSAF